jgi:hypothetical protein
MLLLLALALGRPVGATTPTSPARTDLACPIPVTGFNSLNAFCEGRGMVAGVGNPPILSLILRPVEWTSLPTDPRAQRLQRAAGAGESDPEADNGRSTPLERAQSGYLILWGDEARLSPLPAPARDNPRLARLRALIEDRYGLLFEEGGPATNQVIGSLRTKVKDPSRPGPGVDVAVAGCALCHTGKVFGEVVPGLGNKRIDVETINNLFHHINKTHTPRRELRARPEPFAVEPSASLTATPADLRRRALQVNGRMRDKDWSNRARGPLSDAYVMWWVRGHAAQLIEGADPKAARLLRMDDDSVLGRGEVKIPSLWYFSARRGPSCTTPLQAGGPVTECEVGLFVDGVAASRDLLAGAQLGGDPSITTWRSPAFLQRVADMEAILLSPEKSLRAPAYPCRSDINAELYTAGHRLYRMGRTTAPVTAALKAAEEAAQALQPAGAPPRDRGELGSCQYCHGDPGDPLGWATGTISGPAWAAPEMIPIELVRTDRERLRMVADCRDPLGTKAGRTERAECLQNRQAFDIISAEASKGLNRTLLGRATWADEDPLHGVPIGYFAPRLEGIWARFPYLHNGSVPTLDDLLGDPSQRPRDFSLSDAAEVKGYDRRRAGLRVYVEDDARKLRQLGLTPETSRRMPGYDSPGGVWSDRGDRDNYAVAWWPVGEMGCTPEEADPETGGCWANRGHAYWGSTGLPPGERAALITYLRTVGEGVAEADQPGCAAR